MKIEKSTLWTLIGAGILILIATAALITQGFHVNPLKSSLSIASASPPVGGDNATNLTIKGKSLVVVGCTPQSGYQYCDGSQNIYGYAVASAYLSTNFLGSPINHYENGYYVGPVKLQASLTGGQNLKLYFGNDLGSSWSNIWNVAACGQLGCFLPQVSNPYSVTIATPGHEYKGCPIFLAWAETTYQGAWSWTGTGRGYVGNTGQCIDVRSVQCASNADCSSNEFCDISGSWQTWSCKPKQCNTGQTQCVGTSYQTCSNYQWVNKGQTVGQCGIQCLSNSDCSSGSLCQNNKCVVQPVNYYEFSNNMCTQVSKLPSQKLSNDYATLSECQSHITSTYYEFSNNTCNAVQLTQSQVKPNDYSTLTNCQMNIQTTYYRFFNNTCTMVQLTSSQVNSSVDFADNATCQKQIVYPPKVNWALVGIIAGILILIVLIIVVLEKRKK